MALLLLLILWLTCWLAVKQELLFLMAAAQTKRCFVGVRLTVATDRKLCWLAGGWICVFCRSLLLGVSRFDCFSPLSPSPPLSASHSVKQTQSRTHKLHIHTYRHKVRISGIINRPNEQIALTRALPTGCWSEVGRCFCVWKLDRRAISSLLSEFTIQIGGCWWRCSQPSNHYRHQRTFKTGIFSTYR